MGINSAYNAGIFACQILALKYPYLKEKLRVHKETRRRSGGRGSSAKFWVETM
jgi:phosphoribosylcarboxyaminoimidazole (NCAIR) mutase